MIKAMFLGLFLVTLSNAVNAQPIPGELDGWEGLVSGIPVTTKDLGEYKGVDQIEDSDFFVFSKVFLDGKKVELACEYYISKNKEHYIVHFCN